MKPAHRPIVFAAIAACAAAPVAAQVPATTTPTRVPAYVPVRPATKPLSFQFDVALTLPAFSYNDFLASTGWQAQAALILHRSPYNHLRIEGEYNETAYDKNATNLTGGAELYGGGIGGGRVITNGQTQTETYLVLGGYENAFAACIGSTCTKVSEFQFGTKVGVNAVMGRGRVRPVFDIHWLSTWSQPYASLFSFGLGLRF